MPTSTIDLDGFAPLQPFDNLPSPGFDRFYGVENVDIGEDGEMLILGHVGKLRAVAVFRARLRWLQSRWDADRTLRRLSYALANVEHRWAVRLARCSTYPMCASLGPVDDGKPCHDRWSGRWEAFDGHDWGGWLTDSLDGGRFRGCKRCDLVECDPPRPTVTNRCTQCCEIDDSGEFYIRWDATPETPGAFPVTLWRA